MPGDIVWLDLRDNLVVAARDLSAGTEIVVGDQRIRVAEPVPLGHKLAIRALAVDDPAFKFGQFIGFASRPIAAGDWVHTHNLVAGTLDQGERGPIDVPPPPPPLLGQTFLGYRRRNGRAGTRNYLAIISSVNCSAAVSRAVARHFDTAALRRDFPNVDGVVAFAHGGGCAMQFGGLQHQTLNRVLGGIARHPNVGGYLLIGLGCETGAIGQLLQDQQLVQIDGTAGLDMAAQVPSRCDARPC